jgi:hypothetical protein
MLAVIVDYLPAPQAPLPDPSVGVAAVRERPVGLGNRRGSERLGSFGAAELKAVRLDALVRFQLWSDGPAHAEAIAADLSSRLLGARDLLLAQGVQQVALESVTPAEHVPAANAWRKGIDYRVLYEFGYRDADDAESLIARIPITALPESQDAPGAETTVASDRLVRWDDLAAPPLVVRGRPAVTGLSALAFAVGPEPTQPVTVTRTFDGATGPPTALPTLAAFLDVVAGPEPPARHAAVAFATFTAFLAELGAADGPIELGDWNLDGHLDSYRPLVVQFEPSIELPRHADRLEIAYLAAAFDMSAVCYLRADGG